MHAPLQTIFFSASNMVKTNKSVMDLILIPSFCFFRFGETEVSIYTVEGIKYQPEETRRTIPKTGSFDFRRKI